MVINERQIAGFEASIGRAEAQFGQAVVFYASEPSITDGREALTVFTEERSSSDFMHIPVDVCDYPNSKILGKIVLLQNPKVHRMQPAMLVPDPNNDRLVRLSTLLQPYVPSVGITTGINFALSTEKQIATADFGRHGIEGAFEGGHFGTTLASGKSDEIAQRIEEEGDEATHAFLKPGLHLRYRNLGLAAEEAIPTVTVIDTSSYKTGQRLPLYWHSSLETETGAIEPSMSNAARLLLGAAVSRLGQQGLDRAKQSIDSVIRGVVLV